MKTQKHKYYIFPIPLFIFSIGVILLGCGETIPKKKDTTATITVTATAYNSVEHQTKKGNIGLAAWGDILEPGERAIAVSRDLIKLGLDHNEEIEIKGLEGTYIVKDKMNKRWKKKIDIYMGLNEQAARQWGNQKVEIRFNKKDRPHDKFSEEAR
ncbi:3D domain-containing protein [Aequorivita capsosiphonis]|uniref:3D domain-containing protein n=1 Tax=Aequorivita capsosiphonis TaxID=487317 RepID=UPI00042320F0|nr:3D domain-containing protein [Aequorivita capsosiphonis]